jgi:hypothetical protein
MRPAACGHFPQNVAGLKKQAMAEAAVAALAGKTGFPPRPAGGCGVKTNNLVHCHRNPHRNPATVGKGQKAPCQRCLTPESLRGLRCAQPTLRLLRNSAQILWRSDRN